MRFTSYIPALDVLTTQLDSLSKPSRPHKIMNIFFAAIIIIMRAFRSGYRLRGGLSASIFKDDLSL